MEKEVKCPLCDWIKTIKSIEIDDKKILEKCITDLLIKNLGEHVYKNHLK